MWKSFFILLSSTILLNASLQKGDIYYEKQEYIKAITFYKKSYENTNDKDEAKKRLILTYMKLGDNFFNIQSYQKAKKYYSQAYYLECKKAKKKLSLVYEKEGDLFKRGHKYKQAYKSYSMAQELGNSAVVKRKEKVKSLMEHQTKLVGDTRKIVTKQSPAWTKAIGRLVIPTKITSNGKKVRTKIEKCSATVVNFDKFEHSKVIISASHCLTNFDPNSGVIRFIIKDANGKLIQKYAKPIVDSEFDLKNLTQKSDYAILQLSSFIKSSEVLPLLVPKKSFYELQKQYKTHYGSLGGFSSDVGEFGSYVSYDPKCKLYQYNKVYAKSDCSGFKGASGGPVVLNIFDDKKSESYFVGVVSHFKNKQYKNIFFSPHHIFYKDIQESIRKYNN